MSIKALLLRKYGTKDGEIRGNAPRRIKSVVAGLKRFYAEKESTNQMRLL